PEASTPGTIGRVSGCATVTAGGGGGANLFSGRQPTKSSSAASTNFPTREPDILPPASRPPLRLGLVPLRLAPRQLHKPAVRAQRRLGLVVGGLALSVGAVGVHV